MTILMCAQKLTDASLIYRTEPKTKTRKMRKLKSENGYAQKKRCRARNRGVSPEVEFDAVYILNVMHQKAARCQRMSWGAV